MNASAPRCCFLVEKSWAGRMGVECLIAVLRREDFPVSVIFDELGAKPWGIAGDRVPPDSPLLRHFDTCGVDVLFISVVTDYFRRAVSLIKAIKARHPEIVICCGGAHATYSHQSLLEVPEVDYVCRGEGDIAILGLLEHIKGKRVDLPRGVYAKREGMVIGYGVGDLVAELDSLPFPDKSDHYAAFPGCKSIYTTGTGRGCYNRCSYCNSNTMRNLYKEHGERFMRRRSVENVIAELVEAKRAYAPKWIAFFDDSFMYNTTWLREFARQYKEQVNLPFSCLSNPTFSDEAVLIELVRAGLRFVGVGIQSLNPKIRNEIFCRPESNAQIADFVAMVKRHGIYVQADHIINPWDEREDLLRQLHLYNDIRPSWINVFYLTYYPNTAIMERAVRDGHMSALDQERIDKGLLPANYYFGGSVMKDKLVSIKDISLLLTFIPLLPTKVVNVILRSRALGALRYVPRQIILFARVLNALTRPSDFWGRENLKNFLQSLMPSRKAPACTNPRRPA